MRARSACALLGCVLLGRAAAQSPPEAIDCGVESPTQYVMNVCAAREAEASEARLAKLLAELGGALEPSQSARLAKLQVLWERVREEDCAWEAAFSEGGSIQPWIYAACIKDRTNERVDRLKIFLCEGGGMTGPCDASQRY